MSPVQFRGVWKLGLGIVTLLAMSAQESSLEKVVAEGRELESQGKLSQAEAVFRAAFQQARQGPSEPLVTAAVLDCLASNAADQGRYSDAERLYLRALSIFEHVAGPETKATATVLWHLGGMYVAAGKMASAEPLLAKYQSIILRLTDSSDVGAADLGNLGRIYAFKRAVNKALPLFEKAVEILERESNPDAFDMIRALLDRASCLAVVQKLDRAVADVERASALVVRFQSQSRVVQINLHLTAGLVYAHAHRSSDAQIEFQQAIHVCESSYGLTHPILAMILRDYSQALGLLGDTKQASAVASRAKRIYNANSQTKTLGYTVDINALRQ